ncbi:hypothetical protein HP456_00485 [Bacillus haikouensis]|uniref:hypothetical protein n=1 Tax=Bacillus haikouensis TaxID=1510468 RepID=UPI001554E783|nr:hypothetical protein [Bacillus haikouensis]NQD64398.1 hypothetical protein [Bacillus haikouensis]
MLIEILANFGMSMQIFLRGHPKKERLMKTSDDCWHWSGSINYTYSIKIFSRKIKMSVY